VSAVPGGTLGVDIFFVLSGFLVTSVLQPSMAMAAGSGERWSQLRRFWLRRAVRLGPALGVFLLIWASVGLVSRGSGIFNTAVGHPSDAPSVPMLVDLRGAAAVALYGYNWLAGAGASLPLAFGHLWSLSVEEQFYLLWPIVILAVGRRRGPRFVTGMLAAMIAASILASAVGSSDHGYALNYYGTQSRAQQLLVGSLVAVSWSNGGLRLSRRAAAALGLVGTVVLAIASRHLDEHGWFAAHGGMTLTALAAAAVIVAVLCDG
jgi:peptidoglycan/LPS O-acetylase OafA/YrhL